MLAGIVIIGLDLTCGPETDWSATVSEQDLQFPNEKLLLRRRREVLFFVNFPLVITKSFFQIKNIMLHSLYAYERFRNGGMDSQNLKSLLIFFKSLQIFYETTLTARYEGCARLRHSVQAHACLPPDAVLPDSSSTI